MQFRVLPSDQPFTPDVLELMDESTGKIRRPRMIFYDFLTFFIDPNDLTIYVAHKWITNTGVWAGNITPVTIDKLIAESKDPSEVAAKVLEHQNTELKRVISELMDSRERNRDKGEEGSEYADR